jgi:hypothetical protein
MLCLRDWNFTIFTLENTDNLELREILGLERFWTTLQTLTFHTILTAEQIQHI